ncbi:MAG: nucleotidyltransferase family protein [Defluviitaleaceae bacterium]|nr:nucleotidyltransferase family protein [Defluviitaleaceae bacterium]
MKAIILAAGYATRMYPLTENTPKPLLPLRGKAIIDHIIEQINNMPQVDKIYVVTNSKFYPHFCAWAKDTSGNEVLRNSAAVEVIDDGTTSNENRRGAVGDVYFTISEKSIDDDLLVIAGDNYFTYDLREQYEFFKKTGCDTIAGIELNDTEKLKALAVAVLDAQGKVLELEEKPQIPKSNMAIYATYFFRRETVPLFKQYLDEGNGADLIGAFPQWLYKKFPVYAYKMNGECYDVGTIEMYNQMNKF